MRGQALALVPLAAITVVFTPIEVSAAATFTIKAYDHARCPGPHWVLKSTTAKPLYLRLRRAKLFDTNGDGITDMTESWAVSVSRPLLDAQGRRDGWVNRGSYFVMRWDYATDTWGDPVKVETYGLHFRIACQHT